MFMVLLKFSENKANAGAHMDGHKEWLKRGFDEGVFLLSGSIQSGLGGAILAYDTSLFELQVRVREDPFVVQNVVIAEIVEIAPGQTDERLAFLQNV